MRILMPVAGLFLLACAACAPSRREAPARVPATTTAALDSGHALSDRLRIGDLVVELERTRLEDVQRQLGGLVRDSGQASTSRAWLCFEVQDAHGSVGIVLESTEMGGPENLVMAFKVFRPRTMDTDTGCARLSIPANLVRPDNHLYLGMPRRELEGRLGRGVGLGDTLRFEGSGQLMRRAQSGKAELWDLTRTVDVRLRNDSVAWLQSWKLTSN